MARRFRDEGNDVLHRAGISGRLYGRSVVHLYFGPVRPDDVDGDYEGPSPDAAELMEGRYAAVNGRLSLHLLRRGIATLRGSMFVVVLGRAYGERCYGDAWGIGGVPERYGPGRLYPP